jgi:hypothetical protein
MEFKPATIVTIAIIMVIATTTQGAYAKHLTDDQRYNSGYKDGLADCGQSDVIYQYKQTSAYQGHSDLYHLGYTDGSQHCYTNDNPGSSDNNNPGGSDIGHYTKVSGHGSSQNTDNSNQDNRIQPQGQTNKQTVFCVIAIGTCPTTSGQAQNLQN